MIPIKYRTILYLFLIAEGYVFRAFWGRSLLACISGSKLTNLSSLAKYAKWNTWITELLQLLASQATVVAALRHVSLRKMGTWQNGYVERQQSQGHGKLVHASSMASNGVVAHPWAETPPEPSCNLGPFCSSLYSAWLHNSFRENMRLDVFRISMYIHVLHFHPSCPAPKPWSHSVHVLMKTQRTSISSTCVHTLAFMSPKFGCMHTVDVFFWTT